MAVLAAPGLVVGRSLLDRPSSSSVASTHGSCSFCFPPFWLLVERIDSVLPKVLAALALLLYSW